MVKQHMGTLALNTRIRLSLTRRKMCQVIRSVVPMYSGRVASSPFLPLYLSHLDTSVQYPQFYEGLEKSSQTTAHNHLDLDQQPDSQAQKQDRLVQIRHFGLELSPHSAYHVHSAQYQVLVALVVVH